MAEDTPSIDSPEFALWEARQAARATAREVSRLAGHLRAAVPGARRDTRIDLVLTLAEGSTTPIVARLVADYTRACEEANGAWHRLAELDPTLKMRRLAAG